MRKKFVETLKWIDEKEMLDIIAIAQSSPGAIAVNTSILIGYKIAGVKGALVTVLGTVLPPLLILSVISLFYTAFRDNKVINALLKGMQAGVCAVIMDTLLNMGTQIIKEKKIISLLIMAVSFIAVFFFRINVALVILFGALTGLLTFFYNQKTGKTGVNKGGNDDLP